MANAKFYVYFNLHKDCFSVKHKGRVTAHFTHAILTGCQFKVSQAGRDRVLREKRKNVHAYVACDTVEAFDPQLDTGERVTYNPYAGPTFTVADTGEPVTGARVVSASVVNGRPRLLATFRKPTIFAEQLPGAFTLTL